MAITPYNPRAERAIAGATRGSMFQVDRKAFDDLLNSSVPGNINPMYAGNIIKVVDGLRAIAERLVHEIQKEMVQNGSVFTGELLRAVGKSPKLKVDRNAGTFGVDLEINSKYAARWDSADSEGGFHPNKKQYIPEAVIGEWKKYRGFPQKGEKDYKEGLWVGGSPSSKKYWISGPVAKNESNLHRQLAALSLDAIVGLKNQFAQALTR